MTLRRCLAALAMMLPVAAVSTLACSGGSSGGDGGVDSGADGTLDSGGGVVLVQLSVTLASGSSPVPVALTPAFSPSIHDYYVRCPAAKNELTVSMEASPGSQSQLVQPSKSPAKPMQTITPLAVSENQAIVAAAIGKSKTVEYWVRCLPSDFPGLEWQPHPEAGAPPRGYYLLGNATPAGPYAFVLDSNGVPVWYHLEASHQGLIDVDDVVSKTISYIPVSGKLPVELYALGPPQTETTATPDGRPLDIHEVRALKNGHYLVISSPVQYGVDLTGLSVREVDGGTTALGKDSIINACNLVEFDPKTGKVAWEWKATDHFDPRKVTEDIGGGYLFGDAGAVDGAPVRDVFHCNSIDIDPANENLLVSARQTNSVFYIDRSTDAGTVLWKMGGSDASLDNAAYIPVDTPFYGQHDVRLQAGWSRCTGGQITLFDDHTFSPTMGSARADVYDVHLDSDVCGVHADGGATGGKATLSWQYVGAAPIEASGSFRISADGSRVIGWGLLPDLLMTELDEQKHDLLDLSVAKGSAMASYRAVKVPLTALDLDAMHASAGAP